MGIYLAITDRSNLTLINSLKQLLGSKVPIWDAHQTPNEQTITMVVAWKHPKGSITKNRFPNLKIISSLGAGVEHLIADKAIEKNIILSRIVDTSLQEGMQQYAAWAVFHILKDIPGYIQQQSAKIWQVRLNLKKHKIGLVGYGELGKAIANGLHFLGFQVSAFKNRPTNEKFPYPIFSTKDLPLKEFVQGKTLIVNVLPTTQKTENLFGAAIFDAMDQESGFINMGRGNQVVENDLLVALNSGKIKHAILDVFQQEPLPLDHWMWNHPNVTITPHVASITNPEKAAKIIADNYIRVMNNLSPLFEVSREKGY